jgi:hypothetical protein
MENNRGMSRRPLARLLDGAHPWGSLTIRLDRFGTTRYRLVVYPPGITALDRRRVRRWRGWPLWGALVWMLCEIALAPVVDPWLGFVVSVSVFLGCGAVALYLAGSLRTAVRSVTTTVDGGRPNRTAQAIEAFVATMSDADDRLDRGAISAVDHEAAWWRAYNRISSASGATGVGPQRDGREEGGEDHGPQHGRQHGMM